MDEHGKALIIFLSFKFFKYETIIMCFVFYYRWNVASEFEEKIFVIFGSARRQVESLVNIMQFRLTTGFQPRAT